jgi:hypothetical protein
MLCKSFGACVVDSLARKGAIADSPCVYREHSYKYYFSQWGVTKNIPGPVKEAAIVALGKRIRDSRSTLAVFYNDQAINKKRLRRHISAAEKKKVEADSNIQLSSNV